MMSETQKILSDLYQTKVGDLLETIERDTSVVEQTADSSHVLSLLCKKNHVWVIKDTTTRQLVGVITESDTIQLFAPPYTPFQSFEKPSLQSLQYGRPITAEDIMSKQPVTTKPDEQILEVLAKMRQHKIKQLPVIDENAQLIGEISLSHLIQEYSKHFSQKFVE
jgi:predicted transcriptional regulator